MIIGLTGGIASGKTVCSRWFAERGIPIIDADIIAREVVEPDKPALQQLTAVFGREILNQDRSLNRAALRRLIFTDTAAKTAAESILHPAIAAATQIAIEAYHNTDIIIRAVPLLFENQIDKQCQAVISVDVPEAVQMQRGALRDAADVSEIARIIKVQISRQQRLAQSHYIIDNSGSLDQTYEQCASILYQLRRLLSPA